MWDPPRSNYLFSHLKPAQAAMLDSLAKFGDLGIWKRWCQWLDARSLLPHLQQVCMDESIRFLDATILTDEYVKADVCLDRHAYSSYRSLLASVYRRLSKSCKDVSRTWHLRAPLTSSGTLRRIPQQLLAILREPTSVDHWLDARDNALIALATRLALSPNELAHLQFFSIDYRSSGDALIEVRNTSDRRKSRWIYADREFTEILSQWSDHERSLHPVSIRYFTHVFDAKYGGFRYQLNSERVLQWLHAIAFTRAVQNNLIFEPFHPQALRLERAAELFAAGWSDAMVTEYLGLTHRNGATLRKQLESFVRQ